MRKRCTRGPLKSQSAMRGHHGPTRTAEMDKTDSPRRRPGCAATGALTACAVGAQKAGPLGFPQTRTHACPASQQCHPRARPQEAGARVSRDLRDNAQSGRAPTAGRPGACRQGEGERTVAPSCRGAGLGDKPRTRTALVSPRTPTGRRNARRRPTDADAEAGGRAHGGRAAVGGPHGAIFQGTPLLSVFTGMAPRPCRN